MSQEAHDPEAQDNLEVAFDNCQNLTFHVHNGIWQQFTRQCGMAVDSATKPGYKEFQIQVPGGGPTLDCVYVWGPRDPANPGGAKDGTLTVDLA